MSVKSLVLAAAVLALLYPLATSAFANMYIPVQQVVTAEPLVAHPDVNPVVVPLFDKMPFNDYVPHPFQYTPPAGGHWSKIVLTADFNCTFGRQYDRSCTIAIGDTNVYFGSTPEPSSGYGQSWHVERDVTDYAALLSGSHDAGVMLGNVVNETYTGYITGSARLLFYPAADGASAAATPDAVLPLNSANTAEPLRTTDSALTKTFTELPRNTVRAYLDVIAESQADDEFWYTSAPDSVAKELQDSGGGSFREGEVSVDGKPAGVVPIFPWIYTGGMNPGLWHPLPGVQTLNFKPYRVDLTPFAGVLDDGKPHTISVSVYGAQNNFATTATLLLYCDDAQSQIDGGLTADTLSAPTPVISTDIKAPDKTQASGPATVTSKRNYTISGYIETPSGRVETRLDGQAEFRNAQVYDIRPDSQEQRIRQVTKTQVDTTTTTNRQTQHIHAQSEYDLNLTSMSNQSSGGVNALPNMMVHQSYNTLISTTDPKKRRTTISESNSIDSEAATTVSAAGAHTHASRSVQKYESLSGDGRVYRKVLESKDGVVSGA